jgi:hypothetical protein
LTLFDLGPAIASLASVGLLVGFKKLFPRSEIDEGRKATFVHVSRREGAVIGYAMTASALAVIPLMIIGGLTGLFPDGKLFPLLLSSAAFFGFPLLILAGLVLVRGMSGLREFAHSCAVGHSVSLRGVYAVWILLLITSLWSLVAAVRAYAAWR